MDRLQWRPDHLAEKKKRTFGLRVSIESVRVFHLTSLKFDKHCFQGSELYLEFCRLITLRKLLLEESNLCVLACHLGREDHHEIYFVDHSFTSDRNGPAFYSSEQLHLEPWSQKGV